MKDDDDGHSFESESFGTGVAKPWDSDEIDLARLLYHVPDLAPAVAATIGSTRPADPRLVALHSAALAGGSKRALIDRLVAAAVSPEDAKALAALTCDRELVDHPDRAPVLASAVAMRRAEAAVLAAGAAGDFAALASAYTSHEIMRAAQKEAAEPLPILDLAALDGVTAPPLQWFVTDLLHVRDVGLLTGHGAAGKTQLLLQLAAASVLGRGWLSHMVDRPGPALILCCEDDLDGLHRRLEAIARLYDTTFKALAAAGLVVMSYAGKDATMAEPDRSGVLRPTPLFKRIGDTARDVRPRLIGLDNAADVYAGDENVRRLVRQFITLLRGLAIETVAHVLLTLHPSLTGMNTGTGLSGNTAWFNSVRAQLYLKPAPGEEAEGEGGKPSDLRLLEARKNQHGPLASATTLRWKDGVFVVEGGPTGYHKQAAEKTVDDLFLRLLNRLAAQRRRVSHQPGPTYAPAVFSAEPDAKGMTRKGFADAMTRLFAAEMIHVEEYGPPSARYTRLKAGPKP